MARNSRQSYGFGTGGPLPALAPQPIIATRVPATTDLNFEIGSIWINTATNQAWTLTSVLAGSATWALSSPGASDVDTLTGDGGGAISPAAGNITLAGGTNITTAGGGSTITFNLDAAITVATSVTTPLYTAGAGVDTFIEAVAGQDIVLNMADAAGATSVLFTDSANATVFSVNSNGVMGAFAGLTVTGAFTQTAGVVNMGADAAANAVNIATGAAAKVVTIGSTNGASSLDLLAGTGNFTLEGNVATTYDFSATGANTGTFTLAAGTGARIVNLATGGTGVKTVNLATGAIGNIVTIGTVTDAASLDLLCGTGNFTLEGNVASTYDFSATGANTGTFTLAAGTGARIVNLATGAGGVKTVNLATGAIGNIVTIGTVTAAASLDLLCGTGNFTLEGNVASTYDISSTGVNTGTVRLGSGTGARIVEIAGGGTGIKTVNIAAAATADVVTIGTATGAGSLDLLCGTGNFTLEGDVATTYDFSATGVNTGTFTLAAGTGARIVNLATGGTGVKTVNLATGAIGNIVTIGTVTAAASLDLLCGTGNFTLEGNVASTYDISSTGVNTGLCRFASGTGARTVEIAGGGTGIKTVNIAAAATADVVTIGTTTGAGSLTLAAGTGDITVSGTVKEITSEFTTRSGDSITFQQSPLIGSSLNTGVAATGATGDVNLLSFQEGIIMEQFVVGGGQTIIKPVMTATGLLISGDETNTEGYEYNFGTVRANSRNSFTIGTSAAFFLEWSFRADDISGLEPCLFGFRITQANEAAGNLANYTDFVGYGLNDGVAPGDAVIQTQLNTGGLINTDTNDAWADAATHTLAVLVSGAGVVTFTFDGGVPTATQAFTFDNGDVVHPFFRHEFNAAIPDAIEWISFKCGFQA